MDQKKNFNLTGSFGSAPQYQQVKQSLRKQRSYSEIPKQTLEIKSQAIINNNPIKNLLENAINNRNNLNSKKLKPRIQWCLDSFNMKRHLKGLKARIKWKNQQDGSWVIIRLIFLSNIGHLSPIINNGEVLVELDELNIELTQNEHKLLQNELSKILKNSLRDKPHRKISYTQDEDTQNDCLEQFLLKVQKQLKDKYDKKPKSNVAHKVNREHINGGYIMYHSPVVLVWNPQGYFCLTQNNIPKIRKPYICNPNSFKSQIQLHKTQQNILSINEDQQVTYDNEQPTEKIYEWDCSEQIDFVIKSVEHIMIHEIRSKSAVKDDRKQILGKRSNTNILAYLNQVPHQLRKTYLNFFYQIQRVSQFHRQDKLKVYTVNNQIKKFQNDMLFIIARINTSKDKPVWQTILENELIGYPQVNKGQFIDQFRYLIAKDIIKSRLSQKNYSAHLKAIIIENQHFHYKLSQYFNNQFIRIGKNPPAKYTCLGSYQYFDHVKSQFFFIQLLRNYPKKQLIDSCTQLKLRIFNKKNLHQLKLDWLLSESQRRVFCRSLVSLIWIRDRNYMKFEYRQIARIISTNSEIIKFLTNLNELVVKLEQGKANYITNVIRHYEIFKQKCENNKIARRSFIISCSNCNKSIQLYQISEVGKFIKCFRCKNKKVQPPNKMLNQ